MLPRDLIFKEMQGIKNALYNIEDNDSGFFREQALIALDRWDKLFEIIFGEKKLMNPLIERILKERITELSKVKGNGGLRNQEAEDEIAEIREFLNAPELPSFGNFLRHYGTKYVYVDQHEIIEMITEWYEHGTNDGIKVCHKGAG